MLPIGSGSFPRCRMARSRARIAAAVLLLRAFAASGPATCEAAGLQISAIQATPFPSVPRFEKLEITFQVHGSSATAVQWPYDTAPPAGIRAAAGISVNAVFTDPEGRTFTQPAFCAEEFVDEVRDGRDWHLPTGRFAWKVRFSPDRAGEWAFRITAVDRSGAVESAPRRFTVTSSANRGFVRVSRADPRYFEFDDGSPFNPRGFQFPDHLGNPSTAGAAAYARLGANGVNLVRVAISSIYGSAWNNWIGGRNQYRGYLPVTGLVPMTDSATGRTALVMQLDHEKEGDAGWFDACRMQFWDGQEESIKPNTMYRVRVEYEGTGIAGPRNPAFQRYGFVAKLSEGWYADCHMPGTATVVTAYGRNTQGFGTVEGSWFSGPRNFLPRMYLALENVSSGTARVLSVSLREVLSDGALGPEMMVKPSMEHQHYVPEEKAYSLDRIIEHAERNGVYLKLVLMDLNDKIYFKMADDGSWADQDNPDGFYGLGRGLNKTRWLQQAWWRYAQARWGYSPNVHSWELTNEGDPNLVRHYELADELGKFMHCRAFGIEPGAGDARRCRLNHPNAHLVTTSLWSGFPADQFWRNAKYPNVDYADVHAYVSTSFARPADRRQMQHDAAYYHVWHSRRLASFRVGKPVVRGEAGLDSPGQQSESVLGLRRDRQGVWLHNFLWSGLDAGALHEIYWWNTHIWGDGYDFIGQYKAVSVFMDDVPLNKGGYVDWGGTVSSPSLRVVGQKNTSTGSMHLWVQNKAHTWKNVADGAAIEPVSGTVVIPGFPPGATYALERWNTWESGAHARRAEPVVSDSDGNLTISVASLLSDVAFKLHPGNGRPPGVPTSSVVR